MFRLRKSHFEAAGYGTFSPPSRQDGEEGTPAVGKGLIAPIVERGQVGSDLVTKPFILLIDDDKDWIFLSRIHLLKAGVAYAVAEACDGEEAIAVFKASLLNGELPVFVLLDINMPRVGGFQVLEWIRAEPRLNEVPIIILSSSELRADILRAKELGADAFIAKGNNVACFEALSAQAKEIRAKVTKPANAFEELPGNLLYSPAFEVE